MSAQGATTIMRIDGHCLLPWPERGLVQPSVPNRFRRFAPTGPLCEEEAKYLAAAPEPLAYIATVLADTGMRPEELLPAPMGIRHVGQRSPRFAICDSRENSGCTSLATDDSKGQGGVRNPLERPRKARGRLRMDCAKQEHPRRAVQH
jgi:hypothetical protein